MKDNRFAGFKEKAVRFLERRGFYLVLLGCLGIIGVTAFFTFANTQKEIPQSDLQQVRQSDDDTLEGVLSATPTPLPTQDLLALPTPPASVRTPAPVESPTPGDADPEAVAPKATSSLLFAPVQGSVLLPYAEDTLVYSKTLDQWMSHIGLDIEAETGTPVLSVASGTVERVENDPLMGYRIVVKHDKDDMTSVYANLNQLPDLLAGTKVKAGDELGSVGSSAIVESAEPPHLHFELYIGSKPVDPVPRLQGFEEIPLK